MRLLFLGDRLIGSSAYSKVGFETCTRLQKLGHSIAHIPMGQANRMGKQNFHNILIYESGDDYFGEDVAISDYADFKADMLVTVKEPWVFNNIFRHAVNFVPMAIIDHSPVSKAITSRLDNAFKIIAISRFGQIELKRNAFNSTYIPHGVRCDIYKPLSPEQKLEAKKLFFIPEDEFIVGIVAMNRARKMIPHMLLGYKRFLECNPDVKSRLFLWTNVQPRKPPEDITIGIGDIGVNLLPEIFELGLGEAVRWPQWEQIQKIGGIPDWDPTGGPDMVKLYNSLDAHFLCSGGEGGGLTYLESAACGVPSVGTNYAGAPEYIGPGLTVNWHSYVIINTPGVRHVLADVDGMAEALAKLCNTDREKLGKKCRIHAERHDWKVVVDQYWKPFLEECEEELYPKITKEGLGKWD